MSENTEDFAKDFAELLDEVAEAPALNPPSNQQSKNTKLIGIKAAASPTLTQQAIMPSVGESALPLTTQQKRNIEILTYRQVIEGNSRDHESIRAVWPTSPDYAEAAGPRPSAEAIRRYFGTDEYRRNMDKRGVNIDPADAGLTAEQIAVLSYLADTSITKGFGTRLKDLGVDNATYKAWLRQKPFSDAIRNLAGNALNDSIPIAEVQLAAQAQAGSLPAIKFMMQVTGRYDPIRQEAVDTQALIAVIVDVMQEKLGQQPELLRDIQDAIQFRAQGVRGVIQQ
jgi:hypothetical protein